jgi:hypothetical protein
MKVKWDDEIPNIWKNKIHVPNHQPGWFFSIEKLQVLAGRRRDGGKLLLPPSLIHSRATGAAKPFWKLM